MLSRMKIKDEKDDYGIVLQLFGKTKLWCQEMNMKRKKSKAKDFVLIDNKYVI
jgi:hypothetical protein